jgi:lysophospholipase L1-like esterase
MSFLNIIASLHSGAVVYTPPPPELFSGTAKVICFGDSITWGSYASVSPPTGSYPSQMDVMLDASFTIINEGEPGRTTADAITYLPTVTDQFDVTKDKNVCVLALGVNDFLRDSRTPADTYADLQSICAGLRDAGFYIIILLEPEPNRLEDGVTPGTPDFLTYASLVRSGWASFADDFIDTATNPYIGHYTPAVKDPYWLRPDNDWDRIHPGYAGYTVLATLVKEKLLYLPA